MQEGVGGSVGARRTTEEWEQLVGDHVREIRLADNISQARLAHLADVSVGTIHNLESGAGSSLATLVKVLRALGRQQWFEELRPPAVTFDPVAELEQRERTDRARRRRASPSAPR